MSAQDFYANYKKGKLIFSDEILTRYALSLATKPFVILSGISGTGKTKIAQLFQVPAPSIPATATAQNEKVQGKDYILLTVTAGLAREDGRGNFKFGDLGAILELSEISALEPEIQRLKAIADDANICDPIDLTIVSPDGVEMEMGLYLQRARNPLARLRAKSKRGASRQYDFRSFFNNNYSVGDVLRLEKIGKHKLKIVSRNDESLIQEAHLNEIENTASFATTCFVPVKSNWTDSTELLGYFNPLTGQYCMTKLLEFMLRASDNPSIPFFLILDEMNLSRVEHYFSDFLSCMESRTTNEDGSIRQEGINLYAGGDSIPTDNSEFEEIGSTIEIPLNLYVTGTVNIDDTTHMFSPKVLDRANVIEFNDVYFGQLPDDSSFALSELPNYSQYSKPELEAYEALPNDIKTGIKDIHGLLSQYNMHFGYRTIAEISQFITISRKCIDGTSADIETAALDIQILQKILPKFHGNLSKLNEPILDLIHYLSNTTIEKEKLDFGTVDSIDLSITKFPRSLEKLIRMYKNLHLQGFASFIE